MIVVPDPRRRPVAGLRPLCLAVLLCLASPLALAWWAASHPILTEAAAAALPEDAPEFFRKGAATIAAYSGDPDLWTDPSVPALRDAERSNHFIDLELFEGKDLPASRGEYNRLCRSHRTSAEQAGSLPYALQEYHERLALAFLEHRRRPDDQATRAKILYLAGILAHYAEDAAQPLHTTVDYDGRAKPDKSSPRSGIHLKVDALPEKMKLTAEEIAKELKKVAAPKDGDTPFAAGMAVIKESFGLVDRVYELEPKLPASDAEPPRDPDPAVRAFTLERCRAGAKLTAALWYSAWVRSGKMELPEWHRWATPKPAAGEK
jgi:hypothetical protein